MLTISKIETHLRSIGGFPSDTNLGGLLGMAARATANAAPGLSRAEFLSEMNPYERQERVECAEQLAANRQWLIRVLNPELPASSAELTKTVKAVFTVLSRFGASAINLSQLSEHVNGGHLAVVLRSTADELEHTDAWKEALALAQTVLVRQGIDPQDALLGMIPRK